ncbi:MAG: SusC/RagA family TonB-linked outer membrane protein [Coprobacter sp.]|nr:SusC/RagA family TonB-linked outer membrane protein [Coprobacter sp.]
MKITRKIYLLLVAFVVSQAMAAQSVLTGKVLEKASGEPLAGASVFVQNKDDRTLASVLVDANGEYRIKVPNEQNLVINFSFIGCKTEIVKYTGQKVINISLSEDSHELEAVEVSAKRVEKNAMGLTPREELGAVQRMSMEGLETAPVTSVAEALQGALSNVDIVTGADPGSNSTIRIRGTQSLNASADPLIVVDGVPFPVSTDDFDFASASTDDYSQLLDISPADIESIEVLKDAQATIMWGSKGANGVLEIKTKKGAKGKISFTFSTNAEVKKESSTYPLLNASQYVSLLQDALWNSTNDLGVNDGKVIGSNGYMGLLESDEINFNPGSLLFNEYNVDTDWLDEVSRTGYVIDNNFSMSGGGDKATYRLSLGYLNEKGTTIGTDIQRFSTRFNMKYNFSKKLDITTDFSFTYNIRNLNWSGNKISTPRGMAMSKMPQESPYVMTADGSARTDTYFTPYDDFGMTFTGDKNYNPVALVNEAENRLDSYSTRLTFTLHYQILPSLNYFGTVALTADNKRTATYLPNEVTGVPWVDDSGYTTANSWYNRSTDDASDKLYLYTENRLVYNQTFNEIHRLVAAGQLQIENTTNSSYSTATAGNASYYLSDPSTGGYIVSFGSGESTYREMSANISAQYILMDRYMFNAAFRGEANSNLPVQNRWGKFPTVGFGWLWGDESFMQNQNVVSLGKVRFSWGQTGKAPGNYIGQFKADASGYMDMGSIYPSSIQLDNVKYEVVDKWNLGLDLGVLNDRIMFTVDLYKTVTNDLLMKGMKLPSSTGFSSISYYNSGQMTNRGWEFRMDLNNIVKTKNWSFNFSFNISQNENKVNSLPANLDMENYTFGNGNYAYLVMAGNPLGSFYGYRYKGVYTNVNDTYARDTQGNIIYDIDGEPVITKNGSYTCRPGDAKYEDINGDGVINVNDVVYLGNYSPKLIGGFNFRLAYKTWQLSANFQGRVGQKVYNQARYNSETMRGKNNQSTATLRRWRNEGDVTDIPRALYNEGYNSLGSDRYIEDASFLRMKTLTLKYGLPKNVVKKMHLTAFDLYITAYDLLTFSKYSGQDPEVSDKKMDDTGVIRLAVDGASTPKPIRVKFGINLRF